MLQSSAKVKVGPEEDEKIPTYDYSDKIKQETVDVECKDAQEESKSPKDVQKFLCEICQRQYSNKQSLRKHCLKFHPPYDLYQCKYCKHMLQNKVQREQHIKDRHSEGGDGFTCKICKRRYPKLKKFETHLMGHLHKLESFTCEISYQQFTREIIFKKHLKKHKVANLFACKMCQMKFSDNLTLQKHIRAHAKEKQFFCDICAKKFWRKIDVLNHLNNHTNLDAFQCKYCKSVYSVRKSLHNHIVEKHWKEIENM